jgi:antirestriction protein
MSNYSPRIYVACLASYNAGKLHGAWIDATQDPEEIHAEIRAMLAESPEPGAEEWEIHDTDEFEKIEIEKASIEKISEIAQALEEHGDPFVAYVNNVGLEHASEANFMATFRGTYESAAVYAEETLEDQLSSLPDTLRRYFDFAAYAEDLRHEAHTFLEDSGQVHVFCDEG